MYGNDQSAAFPSRGEKRDEVAAISGKPAGDL
jgi:hypothetical protein